MNANSSDLFIIGWLSVTDSVELLLKHMDWLYAYRASILQKFNATDINQPTSLLASKSQLFHAESHVASYSLQAGDIKS